MSWSEIHDGSVISAEQHRQYEFTGPVTPLEPLNEEVYQLELLGALPDISEAQINIPNSLVVKAGIAAAGLFVAFDLWRARRKK